MLHKIKVECICIFFLLSIFYTFPLMAQSTIKVGAMIGAHISSPTDLPKNLHEKGHSYSVNYVPGYNWAGLLKFNKRNFSITTGIGYKTLNFNFQQKYPSPYTYFTYYVYSVESQIAIQRTLAMVRLNYIYLPLKMNLLLGQKKRFFISIGGEYAMLIHNINMENIEWPGTYLLMHGVDNWFKKNQFFITLGIGTRIKSETILAIEIGFTPKRVDEKYDPTVESEQGYFYFSKKLVEIGITISHDFFRFQI